MQYVDGVSGHGHDLSNRLEKELLHIRELEAELGIKLELHGSVFLPSKKLLAQQRFRPWRGVFLDQQACISLSLKPRPIAL